MVFKISRESVLSSFTKIGKQIIFENYHLEFRLRKNTHHIDLWLYADSSKIDESQTANKFRLRIDLSQCEELLQNEDFKNYSNILKNDIIKVKQLFFLINLCLKDRTSSAQQ